MPWNFVFYKMTISLAEWDGEGKKYETQKIAFFRKVGFSSRYESVECALTQLS